MDNNEGIDELGAALGEMLDSCLDRGLIPPLYLTCVAPDGRCMVIRCAPGESSEFDAEMVVEHRVSRGLRLPLSIMVSDSEGSEPLLFVMDSETRHPRVVH
jgi:hypothetical protein